MAVTRTDFVVPLGFDGPALLNKLGEAIAQIGLMETPTSWYDSFTDTSGHEYRVFAQTAGTGTRNTIYHMFFCASGLTNLWYTNFSQYDVATHKSTGSQYLDYVRSYNWPGELSTGWTSYYVGIAECSNASDFTFTTLENATGNFDVIWANNASESRVMGFITGTPTIDLGAPDLDDVSPPLSMMGIHESSAGVNFVSASNLKSNILTGWHDGGNSAADYTPQATTLGFWSVSGANEWCYYMGDTESNSSRNHFYGAGGSGYAQNIPDSFRASFQARLCYPFFQDVNSGDIGCISGHIDAFTPGAGDVLVVEAGVEEYLVFTTQSGVDPGQYGNMWTATVARIV